MIRKPILLILFLLVLTSAYTLGQSGPTLAERLGYSADAKLLIVHADDLAVAHSVNRATFDALTNGSVSSASIMVPCPWMEEVADWARNNRSADLGIHLTLTSEWKHFRWGPVSRNGADGLTDPIGYLWPSVKEVNDNAGVEAVEAELRAQIDLAKKMGIEPTHLDSHMGTLFSQPSFLEIYLRLGREYNLPVFLIRRMTSFLPFAKDLLSGNEVLVDHFFMLQPAHREKGFAEVYEETLRNLQPGLTQIIIHAGFDDEELKGVSIEHPDYGSAWRQQDYDFFTSEKCATLLRENDVHLIGWREIKKLID